MRNPLVCSHTHCKISITLVADTHNYACIFSKLWQVAVGDFSDLAISIGTLVMLRPQRTPNIIFSISVTLLIPSTRLACKHGAYVTIYYVNAYCTLPCRWIHSKTNGFWLEAGLQEPWRPVNSRSSFQGLLLELNGSSLVQAPLKKLQRFSFFFFKARSNRIQPEGHLF